MRRISSVCQSHTGKLAQLLAAHQQSKEILQHLQKHLPGVVAEHLVAAHFQQGRLLLYVDASVWVSRLRFLNKHVQQVWQEQMRNFPPVQRIEVRVYQTEAGFAQILAPAQPLSEQSRALLQCLAESVDYPPLQQSLQHLSEANPTHDDEPEEP